ncbi:unnamed protein product [Gongylonema pulchrum]|uniref:Secreted protein n=1 Tax=Gongylonema pulchrum TaxID=637853 RepID=A0A183D934_9BILA|nr:unnamed protein product [Gongylonema pulchrum]
MLFLLPPSFSTAAATDAEDDDAPDTATAGDVSGDADEGSTKDGEADVNDVLDVSAIDSRRSFGSHLLIT